MLCVLKSKAADQPLLTGLQGCIVLDLVISVCIP